MRGGVDMMEDKKNRRFFLNLPSRTKYKTGRDKTNRWGVLT